MTRDTLMRRRRQHVYADEASRRGRTGRGVPAARARAGAAAYAAAAAR